MGKFSEKQIKSIIKEALNDYDRTCDNNPEDIDKIYKRNEYMIKDVTKECQHCYNYVGQCVILGDERNEVGELINPFGQQILDVAIDYHWWAISSANRNIVEIKDNRIK